MNKRREERMTLKELRSASIEEIKEEIKKKNKWVGVHIRSMYNMSIGEWLDLKLIEEVWS